jgi:hypothetical protein
MLKKGIKGRFRKKEKRRGRMTERKEREGVRDQMR